MLLNLFLFLSFSLAELCWDFNKNSFIRNTDEARVFIVAFDGGIAEYSSLGMVDVPLMWYCCIFISHWEMKGSCEPIYFSSLIDIFEAAHTTAPATCHHLPLIFAPHAVCLNLPSFPVPVRPPALLPLAWYKIPVSPLGVRPYQVPPSPLYPPLALAQKYIRQETKNQKMHVFRGEIREGEAGAQGRRRDLLRTNPQGADRALVSGQG